MVAVEEKTHTGVVTNLIGDKAVIHLLVPESCHSCGMKDFCNAEDEDRTRFVVPNDHFEIGDSVILEVGTKTGFLAVFWAYLMPFLLIILSLIFGTLFALSEGFSAMMALSLLVLYYPLLARFGKRFRFHLKVTKHE